MILKKTFFLFLIIILSINISYAQSDHSYNSNDSDVPLFSGSGFIDFQTEFNITQNGIIGIDYSIDNMSLSFIYELIDNIAVEIVSPEGTVLDLSSYNGLAVEGGFDGAIFQDGGNDITQESFAFQGTGITGTYEPEGGTFQETFSGENIQGTWTLKITSSQFAFSYHTNMFYGSSFNFSDLTCPSYFQLDIENVSVNTATLSWMNSNTASINNYEYVVMAAGDAVDVNSAVATGQTSPSSDGIGISGLSENTSYDAYIRSICSGNVNSDFEGPITFQTSSLGDFPYLETFQGGIQTPMTQNDPNAQINVSNNCSTDYGDYLKINGGDHSIITPVLPVSAENEIKLSFLIYKSCDDPSEDGESLEISYFNGNDQQNIATIDPANLTSSWEEKTYSINSGLTDDFKVRFKRNGGSNNADDLNIDNVFIRSSNTCQVPFNLEVSQVEPDHATFQWTFYPDASQGFDWLIMQDGEAPDTSTAVASGNIASGENTLTTDQVLTDGIDYDFYIRSDCGANGSSSYSDAVNFSTPCKVSVPYQVDFEAGFPNCHFVTDPAFVSLKTGCGENDSQFLSIDGGQGYGTHPMDMSNETSLDVSWRLKKSCFDPAEDGETLKAEYWNGSAWQLLEEYDPATMTDDWRTYYYTIDSGLNTHFRLSFDRTGGSADFDDINIDDIQIERTPDCAAPATFNLSNLSGSSVDIDWEASSSESNGYEWVVMGKNEEVNPALSIATGKVASGVTSTNVSGLTASTDHDFYIRTECANGWSDFRGPYRFQTTCEPEDLPYLEDFETGFPNCWTRSNEDQIKILSGCDDNASQFMQMQGGEISYTTKTIDVSNESSINISWDIYNGCTDAAEAGETFAVDYWDGSTWQNLVSLDPADLSATWTTEEHDLSSGLTQDFKLRFSRPSGNGSSAGTDDINIDDLAIETNDVSPEPYPSGNGTAGDPYEIATVGNLLYLANSDASNQHFIQTADLDLNNVSWNDFIDLGNSSYDGQGHIIDNLTLTSTFFTRLGGSVFKNIGFENAILNNSNLDGLFEVPNGSTIENFYFEGAVHEDNNVFGFGFIGVIKNSYVIIDEYSGGIGSIFTIINQSSILNSYFSSKQPADIISIGIVPSAVTSNVYYNSDQLSIFPNINQTFNALSNVQMQQQSSFNGFDFNNIWYMDANENYGYPQLQAFLNIDHTYENGNWFPTAPPANNTSPVSVKVSDQNAAINDALMVSDLTVDNGADLTVNDVLRVEGTFNNQGSITFSSDENGSGQFDEFNGEMINNDGMTVERYFSPTRAFRFATPAVTTSTSIYENWQESGNSPAGYGTHITGSQTGDDGFDASQTGNPSMYGFDNSFVGDQSNAWFPVPNTDNTDLKAGDAYRIFIRGDRNYDLNSYPADPPNTATKLRTTGSLHIGDFSPELSDQANYYSLIGNPYQAYVDFDQLNLSNVNPNFYWVWDPNISSRGAYVSIDMNTGVSAGSSEANQFIPPGQSFFVQTMINGNAYIGFREAAKDVSATPVSVFSSDDVASMNIRLYKTVDINSDATESDVVSINFSANHLDAVNFNDAQKLGNPDENLAVKNNGKYLSIENRSIPDENDQIQLFTSGYTTELYTFKIDLSGLADNVQPKLYDHYTSEMHLLNDDENFISFEVDPAVPESVASDRFEIRFDIETLNNSEFQDQNIVIYPNPVEHELHLRTKGNSVELNFQIYDIAGKKLNINTLDNEDKVIVFDVSDLQSGVYFIEVKSDQQTIKKRFIVK